MKFRKAKVLLEKDGWELDRVRGSHYVYIKDDTEFILPHHSGDISRVVKINLLKLLKGARDEASNYCGSLSEET